MAFIKCNFYSDAIKNSTDISVVIPTPSDLDGKTGADYFCDGAKYQVLYLLHGTYADYADWTRLSSVERYAQEHKIILVCPSGQNSMWQDMYVGPQYFTYITEELPKFVKTMFPISDKREDTFIGGLSMGAFGAMNAGIRRPDLYSAVIALSGGMRLGKFLQGKDIEDTNLPWPIKAIIPPPYDGRGTGLDDIPILEKLIRNGKIAPRIYMACGTEDFVYNTVRESRVLLDNLGVSYTYEEGPGEHNWDFWDPYIRRAIKWLCAKGTTV